jgi:hypothetical protein
LRLALVALLAILAAGTASAAPRDWPALAGSTGNAQCEQALTLGLQAYRSNAFYLLEPLAAPDGFPSQIVLQRSGLDISGGDALAADDRVFERVPLARGFGRLYWQREPRDGFRLAIREIHHGWRGDNYGVFVMPAAAPRFDGENAEPPSAVEASAWDPPLVLRDRASDAIWFISTERHDMAAWSVHSVDAQAHQADCVVRFRPPDESGDPLLPAAVTDFAALVDATLGDGRNEGTLRPTAGRRLFTRYLYWNAAMRPWAITDRTYNTRTQLDAAMRRWARSQPSFRTAHDAIIAQYPIARDTLAAYYAEHFDLTPAQADAQASFALDVAYRSAYVFPGGGGAGTARRPANPNPWPAAAEQHAR